MLYMYINTAAFCNVKIAKRAILFNTIVKYVNEQKYKLFMCGKFKYPQK